MFWWVTLRLHSQPLDPSQGHFLTSAFNTSTEFYLFSNQIQKIQICVCYLIREKAFRMILMESKCRDHTRGSTGDETSTCLALLFVSCVLSNSQPAEHLLKYLCYILSSQLKTFQGCGYLIHLILLNVINVVVV